MHGLKNFQGQRLVSWSSMTRTFLADNNTVDLAIVPGTLRCVTYNAMFTDAGAHFTRYIDDRSE